MFGCPTVSELRFYGFCHHCFFFFTIFDLIYPGNSNAQSLRGKFLARALAIFLRTLMDADKTRLIEKIMDIDSGAAAENAEAASASSRLAAKTATLNTPEMKGQLEKLKSFKSNKGKFLC